MLHIQQKHIIPPEQCYSCPLGVNLIDGPLKYMLFFSALQL